MYTWFEVHLMLQERIAERTLDGYRDAAEDIHDLNKAIEPDAGVVVYVYAETIPNGCIHGRSDPSTPDACDSGKEGKALGLLRGSIP
jgi:hypothetical protein